MVIFHNFFQPPNEFFSLDETNARKVQGTFSSNPIPFLAIKYYEYLQKFEINFAMDSEVDTPVHYFKVLPEHYLEPVKSVHKRKRTRKIGRNVPCPCGSGKKYKKCCLKL
ncbi:MAG: YecA family protein [Promethearchaeota archaeon]